MTKSSQEFYRSICMMLFVGTLLGLSSCVTHSITTDKLGIESPYEQPTALYFKTMKIRTLSMKSNYRNLFKTNFTKLFRDIEEVRGLSSYSKGSFDLLVTVQFDQSFKNSMKTSLYQDITVDAYTKEGIKLASFKNRKTYDHLLPATEFEHETDLNKTLLPILKAMAEDRRIKQYLDSQVYQQPSAAGLSVGGKAVKITHFDYDQDSRKGSISISTKGLNALNAREWLVKNIGKICSSKNVVLESGSEKLTEGHYKVLDESIKDDVLTIHFEAVW